MNINEFKQKHSNLIAEFREEQPNRHPFLGKIFTKFFLYWLLQEKNIKISFKYTEIKPYNHISEFFLNFLNEHAYFSKRVLIGIYTNKVHPPVDKYEYIRKEFAKLISHGLKYGVLEKYSLYTFKINKDMVSQYS